MADRTCSVEGCERTQYGNQPYCKGHHQRVTRTGYPGPAHLARAQTGGPCSVDGCGRPARSKDLCNRCYQRLWNHGDPTARFNNNGKPALERFTEKRIIDESGCWFWTGTINRKGYGMFWPTANGTPAHRWSYEHYVGPIPEGLQLDHLCRVRRCVNPAHLEPVTAKENQVRSPFDPAARTHCRQGHAFDEENTYRPPDGRRVCRACASQARAAHEAKKRSKVDAVRRDRSR